MHVANKWNGRGLIVKLIIAIAVGFGVVSLATNIVTIVIFQRQLKVRLKASHPKEN